MDVPRRRRPRDLRQGNLPTAGRPNEGIELDSAEGCQGKGGAVAGGPRAAGVPPVAALRGGVRGVPEGGAGRRACLPSASTQAQERYPGVHLNGSVDRSSD